MTEIGESHPENHGQDIADCDDGVDGRLEEGFHLQKACDHVRLDCNNCHGNRVIQDDNSSFSFCLQHIHIEKFDDNFSHAHLCHRS